MEEWKPLTYHGEWFGDTYEVSNQGRIKNIVTGKIRKLSLNKQGYLHCVISRGRKRKIAIKVHRAVAENFVTGKEDGLVINHIDGNKLNNNKDNLEWVTISENVLHAYRIGLSLKVKGFENKSTKVTKEIVDNIRRDYKTGKYYQKDLAIKYGVSRTAINDIVNMKRFANV